MEVVRRLRLFTPSAAPWWIVAVSAGALAVALASQYWGGLAPCVLCIYQRYAFGVSLALGLIALLPLPGAAALRRTLVGLAGLAFLGGAAIAFFHVGVEQHWWRGTAACHAPAIDLNASVEQLREQLLATDFAPCDRIPWSLFGLSFAGFNVIFSVMFAVGCFAALRKRDVVGHNRTASAH